MAVDIVTGGTFTETTSGSVTRANIRIGAVDGTAFIDFSSGTDITDNVDKIITVKDSASKAISGYIKAAGTAETLGTELITDGGFAAVTETNVYTSDFSAGVDGCVAGAGAVAGNIDGIGGQVDTLRFTTNGVSGLHFISKSMLTVGSSYRLRSNAYIVSGQSNIDQVKFYDGGGSSYGVTVTTTDSWQSVDFYIVATQNALLALALDGGAATFQDAGADDVFYIKNTIVDRVDFYSWQNWGPYASSGALQNKAYKAASVSTNLEQSATAAEAGKLYKVVWTLTKLAGDAGDGITAEFGSTDGTLRTASGTYTDYITAADTDYLKFKPTDSDANLSVTIDDVSVKEVTAPASTGATIVSTLSGLTYNWMFKDSAFNYGDSSGYTYEIYSADWTYGTGWYPSGGVATKSAGTASDLEQNVGAISAEIYNLLYSLTRTAGSVNSEIGGTDGATQSATASIDENITATNNGNLKIQANATFAGTVDSIICYPSLRPVEIGIFSRLSANSNVTGIVGTKIFAGTAPQDVSLPYITFFKVSEVPTRAMISDPALKRPRIQVSCWSTDYLQVKSIARTVILALKDYSDTTGGVSFQRIFYDDETNLTEVDPDTNKIIHHVAQDYLAWHD